MGFLVMEETFDGWSAAKNGNSHDFSEYFNQTITADNGILGGKNGQTWVEFTLKSMVLRDRNDPSFIMWDIGNEITNIIGSGSTSKYTTYCSNMISWVQSLDMTRPITHGDNNGAVKTTSTGVTAKVDRLIAESGGVVGFNYYVSQMATTHKNYPNWKLVATETVSSINSRGAYNRYTSSSSLYQSSNGPYVGNAYDNYCVFWGTTALSVRVNVTYTPGSIYVVAYDANGNVIENTVGNSRVNTPGAAAKIDAYADKREMAADGYSLCYITLDVTDSNGNLDTAATNRIQLSLSGEGEIVGVDNGDPATLRKYQQSTVLTSATTANIDAYAGKALVIVRSTKNGGGFTLTASSNGLTSDSVTVNTIAPVEETPEISVEAITLNVNELELEIGETFALEAEVTPENADDKTVTWSSSDPQVVTVVDGVVTAVNYGTATVTASVGDITAQCLVTVPEPAPVVTGIQMSQTAMSMNIGDTATLTVEITPAECADAQVTWSSSDPEVATVAGGTVTAVSEGTTVITAMVGEFSATCTVTVNGQEELPEKVAPTVGVEVTYQNSKTTITGQSDIFVNPDLYYTEVKHGILYITSSLLGSRNLLVSTSGATNKVLSGFEEGGTFSYTFKPLSGSMAYTYRAYVYYEKPDGSRIYVYSPMVRGSGRSFSVD